MDDVFYRGSDFNHPRRSHATIFIRGSSINTSRSTATVRGNANTMAEQANLRICIRLNPAIWIPKDPLSVPFRARCIYFLVVTGIFQLHFYTKWGNCRKRKFFCVYKNSGNFCLNLPVVFRLLRGRGQ